MSRIYAQNTTFAYGVGILGTGVISLISYYSIRVWEYCRRPGRGSGPTISLTRAGSATEVRDRATQTSSDTQSSDTSSTSGSELNLRHEVSSRETEIRTLRKSLSTTQARARSGEEELTRTKQQLLEIKKHKDLLEAELTRVKEEVAGLEGQVAQRNKAIMVLQEEQERAQLLQSRTSELLGTRTAELEVVKKFLDYTDQYSETDVKRMVEDLNFQILHTAAMIAEFFEFHRRAEVERNDSEDTESMAEHLVEVLGHRMTQLLRDSEHHDDPILVQMCLQATMCAFADWYIASWFFHDRETERLLNDLYERLRECGMCFFQKNLELS